MFDCNIGGSCKVACNATSSFFSDSIFAVISSTLLPSVLLTVIGPSKPNPHSDLGIDITESLTSGILTVSVPSTEILYDNLFSASILPSTSTSEGGFSSPSEFNTFNIMSSPLKSISILLCELVVSSLPVSESFN